MRSRDEWRGAGPVVDRRGFLLGTAALLPAALLYGCGASDAPAKAGPGKLGGDAGADGGAAALDRDQLHAVVQARLKSQNDRHLDAFMALYADGAEVVMNGSAKSGATSIGAAYEQFGISPAERGLRGTRVSLDHEYYTEDSILIEGRFFGTHVGVIEGFPPTQNDIQIAYLSFLRLDDSGKIVAERTVMNWGLLTVMGPLPALPP